MIKIVNVSENTALKKKGIRPGTYLLAINGNKVSDQLDVAFNSDEKDFLVEFKDLSGKIRHTKIKNTDLYDIEFEPIKPKKCGANCIFCFINQLPKGLRKTLYHKDEDYRFSYIYGNYVSFANVHKTDLEKIVKYRLSPLYISVHTTDPVLRGKMLGLKKDAPILPYLEYLTNNRITLHCQIVLCPDINDGNVLNKSILELSKFYPYLSDVAVVPVGLTAHRKGLFKLKNVDKNKADEIFEQIKDMQTRFLKELKTPFVFLSDEFYLLADKKIPKKEFYRDFSQIENGVGILRSVIDDVEKLFLKGVKKGFSNKKIAVVTGMLSYKFILNYFRKFVRKVGLSINLYPVANTLLGDSITVTGLLSGKDIMRTLSNEDFDILLIPDVMLRDAKNTFLDDVTVKQLENYFGVKVYTFSPLFSELYKKLCILSKKKVI